MSRSHNLTDEQYLAALKRNRERIAAGLSFDAVDSNTIGDKYTEASWGLCSESRELWPDDTNLFPHLNGRFAPKYRRADQMCPMDTRAHSNGNGCFYTCRIFKTREISAKRRDQALALYDALILKVEGKALAAAAREGGDVEQAPGEAPQSGGDSRNAQRTHP